MPRSIAVITAVIPDPRSEGGSLRLWHILRLFKKNGINVTILPLENNFQTLSENSVQERYDYWRNFDVVCIDSQQSIENHLELKGDSYSAFWYDGYIPASLALAKLKKNYPQATHIYDTIDLAHRRFFREAKIKNNKKLLLKAIGVKRTEYALAANANVTVAISPEEATILETDVTTASVIYLPNIHICQNNTPPFESRQGVTFIGNYYHTPNLDAVQWLCQEIWPRCLELDSTLQLNLVGAGPLDTIDIPRNQNINVLGYVEDLESLINTSRLTVAPLRFGAGIKGKVLFSLSQGVPCIGTPIAAEGMPSQIKEALMISSDSNAIATAINALHNEKTDWLTLRTKGLNTVEQSYGLRISKKRIQAFIEEYL